MKAKLSALEKCFSSCQQMYQLLGQSRSREKPGKIEDFRVRIFGRGRPLLKIERELLTSVRTLALCNRSPGEDETLDETVDGAAPNCGASSIDVRCHGEASGHWATQRLIDHAVQHYDLRACDQHAVAVQLEPAEKCRRVEMRIASAVRHDLASRKSAQSVAHARHCNLLRRRRARRLNQADHERADQKCNGPCSPPIGWG